MKKTLADALRAIARRLDPPAPIVLHIGRVPTGSANQIAQNIDWHFRAGGNF